VTMVSNNEGAPDCSLLVLRESSDYASLVAGRDFDEGEIIAHFTAKETLSNPTYLTVQAGSSQHISLAPDYLQYTNHSCEPNAFFDTQHGKMIALRPIKVGAAITYFYPSTEWSMDRPFTCLCGTESCLGEIAGASQLGREALGRYRIAPHIADLFKGQASAE